MILFKLLLFVALLGAGYAAVQARRRNEKVDASGAGAADLLKSGSASIEEIANGLGMLIRRKKVTDVALLSSYIQKLDAAIAVSPLPSKFSLREKKVGAFNDMLIVATGQIQDFVHTYGGTKEITHKHNCWFHVVVTPQEQQVDYFSAMPDDKDHQYMLEDLADYLHGLVK
jgi:hypothetical protein